jgi:hypothetical protein
MLYAKGVFCVKFTFKSSSNDYFDFDVDNFITDEYVPSPLWDLKSEANYTDGRSSPFDVYSETT